MEALAVWRKSEASLEHGKTIPELKILVRQSVRNVIGQHAINIEAFMGIHVIKSNHPCTDGVE